MISCESLSKNLLFLHSLFYKLLRMLNKANNYWAILDAEPGCRGCISNMNIPDMAEKTKFGTTTQRGK